MVKSTISTLTSAYKSEKFLNKFLKSVKKQNLNNLTLGLELIKPTEIELNTVKKYQKKINISYSCDPFVSSLSKSWNKIIKNVDSDYFCIWNVDDLRSKNSIYMQYDFLQNNPNIDFVYGNYFIVRKFGSKKGKYINESGREIELTRSMILGPFFMFRKKVLEKIQPFDEQLKSGCDFDFAIRMAKLFNGHHINKNLGWYLNQGKGLSTNSNQLQEIERTVIQLRYGHQVTSPEHINFAEENYDIRHIYVNNKKYLV